MSAQPLAVTPPPRHDHSDGSEKMVPAGSALKAAQPTILYVDDEPDALAVLGWFLSAEGWDVITACNATEALVQIEQHLPDVIITDYLMPGMTGLELCGQLRKCERTRKIPIILYTALCLPRDSWLYDRTFIKPTDLDVFAREIRSLLVRTH